MAYRKKNRDINIFSMSALDLFASALGAFIIISVIALPYYLKKDKFELKPIDIVFVLDTTGSMQGPINALGQNIIGIVDILQKVSSSLNVGFVAYKDYEDEYLTLPFPLRAMTASSKKELTNFIKGLQASSTVNKETEEAVEAAIEKAMSFQWRPNVRQFIVVIADAPARNEKVDQNLKLAKTFHNNDRNKRLSAIYAEEWDKQPGVKAEDLKAWRDRWKSVTTDFMKKLAEAGGGEFIEDRGRMLESVLLSVL
ncbi:MAG: VWA domain-containing protein [Methylobacter sp.]